MVQNNSWSQAKCLFSPTLFNIFLEGIMSDPMEEHDGKVCIDRRTITSLRFADGIDALGLRIARARGSS